MNNQNITIILLLAVLTSCSTMRKTVTLGATAGALTGAIAGHHLSSGQSNNTTKGLAIGAIIGGISSYFIQKGLEKRDANTRKQTLFNLERFGVNGHSHKSTKRSSAPFSLSPAMVDQDYIETHVEDGNRLIEGHRVWTISEEAQWIPSMQETRE